MKIGISVSTLGTKNGENNKHRVQLVGKKGRLMYKGVSAKKKASNHNRFELLSWRGRYLRR